MFYLLWHPCQGWENLHMSFHNCSVLVLIVYHVTQLRSTRGDGEENCVMFQVEQKARREDVLNQLLLLLNTAINRKEREKSAGSRGGSGKVRRRDSKRKSSRVEVVVPQSTEEEEEDRDDETNYMSGALGLIPTS